MALSPVLRWLLLGLLPSCIGYGIPKAEKLRTVVTTDMEQDDLASLIRYLLYTNDVETQGLIYSSSKWHWAGDGKGTKFYLPEREYNTSQTSWRWTGTRTIQDIVIPAYGEVYENLRQHDPSYPTADELQSIVKIGNIDFEGEFDHDTEGSNLIKSLLLDDDPRTLYLQIWGGVNTVARALLSIENDYIESVQWGQIYTKVSKKAVILASGFQDYAYFQYVALKWPQIRVEDFSPAYETWGYNWDKGYGNTRGLPDANEYFTGDWIKANIQIGPYARLYRSWGDGQRMPGDPLDVFGFANETSATFKRLPAYSFLSEGDNVAFNALLTTGIQDPTNPKLGGWGGRSVQNSTTPDLWTLVDDEKTLNGTTIGLYTTDCWMEAAQNDFAARVQWTLTPKYSDGNHAPSVKISNGGNVKASPGSKVTLHAAISDPDGDDVTISWWQYKAEGTYPGSVELSGASSKQVKVAIAGDAKAGQTISIILQGKDSGDFPLTRYARAIIEVT